MANLVKTYTTAIVAAIVIAITLAMTKTSFAQTDTAQTFAHNDTICLIRNINITGNKKTKPKIILCELEFEPGDTISKSRLPQLLDKSTTNLKKNFHFQLCNNHLRIRIRFALYRINRHRHQYQRGRMLVHVANV